MKIFELRNLIEETIDEMVINEMPPSRGIKFTDNWEEKWNSAPDNIKSSIRFKRIIDFFKENESGTLKDIAKEKFNSNDTASCNQQVAFLKSLGILEDTGYVTPLKDKERKNPEGVYGRPKVTDEETKMLGVSIIRKFSKGNTEFTDEEKDLITKLYNSIS
jgi:methyltransferase-like protein